MYKVRLLDVVIAVVEWTIKYSLENVVKEFNLMGFASVLLVQNFPNVGNDPCTYNSFTVHDYSTCHNPIYQMFPLNNERYVVLAS